MTEAQGGGIKLLIAFKTGRGYRVHVIDLLTLLLVLAICGYYAVVWARVGWDGPRGTLVIQYSPPPELSPAMMRYVWKQGFDYRALLAAILSLVSKGLASLNSSSGVTRIRPTRESPSTCTLPDEERWLLEDFVRRHGKQGSDLDMLGTDASFAAAQTAQILRRKAMGRWFDANRQYVTTGCIFSIAPVFVAARPQDFKQVMALVTPLALSAVGAFYLVFITLRLRDLLRAVRGQSRREVVRRSVVLLAVLVPCIASLLTGSAVLLFAFGPRVLWTTAFVVALNLAMLHLMKAPTVEGRKLLRHIRGFREFLLSVERLPKDRPDDPSEPGGVYERYLPYAIALEVDQQWGDKFVALTSTYSAPSFIPGAHEFYLGLWDDRPPETIIQLKLESGSR